METLALRDNGETGVFLVARVVLARWASMVCMVKTG